MRQIKVRGWHTELNKMFSAEEMGIDQLTLSTDGRGFVNVHGGNTSLSVFAGDKMIPIQFIGLLDKNGKEIYEGDIVFDEDGEYSKTVVITCKDEYLEFFGKDIHTDDSFSLEEIDGEIIGNIYENKELLEIK